MLNFNDLVSISLYRSRSCDMSTKWNGEPCPSCRNGILNHGVKKTVFDYRGKSFEYEQLGAWCRQCSEGVLTGDETTATEPLLDAFVTQVHKEETKELARIRKKLKLTQQQAANLTGGGHNAFSRYERGDARPLPAVMNLFRLLDHHPELLKEL